MAWVFYVVDPAALDAPRALKMLKPGVAAGDLFRRFQDEARILAHLDHPNLVSIYEFGFDEASGCHFYTMTLVDTPPLSQRGVLRIENAAPIFLDVIKGLAKLHENDIIHRDIKPQNILIHSDGRGMLADLGIARTADLAEGDTWFPTAEARGTTTGVAIGTPAYMSPEQARGQRGISKATDVFSFGLTMYHTLTGRIIYSEIEEIDSRSGQEILAYLGHLSFSRKDFVFHFEDTPEPIQQVIRNACKIDPKERFADAAGMLEALEEAFYQVDQGPTVSWARIGVGAALVTALALGGYSAWESYAKHREAALLEEVSNLEREVADAFQAADADAATPAQVLAAANEKRRSAEVLLQEGRHNHEVGGSDASPFLNDAQNSFLESCQTLVQGDLAGRFGLATDELKRRADALAKLNPQELDPQGWAELERQIVALAPPQDTAEKCQLIKSYQAKLASVPVVSNSVEKLEQQFKREWPKLAEGTREDAVRIQNELVPVPAPEFLGSLEGARQSLAAGDEALKAGSYLAARDAYNKAKDGFAGARMIADTYRSQQSVRTLQAQAASKKVSDAETDKRVAEADRLYAAGNYEAAKRAYDEAVGFLNSAIAAGEVANGVLVVKQAALEARGRALADGAEKSAISEVGEAEAAFRDADSKFAGKQFEDAQRAYADAETKFAAADKQAVTALDDSRKEGTNARATAKKLGDCTALNAPNSKSLCAEAQTNLAQGDAAVEGRDASAALEHYGTARRSFEDAITTEEAYKANKNVPPEIVSKKPASPQYEAHTGETLHFEIVARDKNPADVLHYAWSVGGKSRPEAGPSLDLRAEANNNVEVRVDDGHPDGVTSTTWNVVIKNRPPKLTLSPESDLALRIGQTTTFNATAEDPDGDEVTVDYLVDGKPVSHGGANVSYLYDAQKPGRFVLEARATDTKGAVTSAKRRINVQPNENHPPKLTLSPQSDLVLHIGQSTTFTAKADDPDGDEVTIDYFVDGRPMSHGGANVSYLYDAQKPGSFVLEARATDARGASTSTKRRIDVQPNQPSRVALTLSPSEEKVTVRVGDHVKFRAAVGSESGTAIPVVFLLDGEQVGTGTVYEFVASSEGKHHLEVRAGEGSALAHLERQIEVAAKPPPPEAEALATMKEYEAAYEARDIDRLARIWEMSSDQKENMKKFFGSIKTLSIVIDKVRVQQNGDRLSVEFDQKVTAPDVQPTQAALVATLVRNESGSGWKIEKMRPR
jgi:serine/threonine-protein kinase